jgi:hypothetical protein
LIVYLVIAAAAAAAAMDFSSLQSLSLSNSSMQQDPHNNSSSTSTPTSNSPLFHYQNTNVNTSTNSSVVNNSSLNSSANISPTNQYSFRPRASSLPDIGNKSNLNDKSVQLLREQLELQLAIAANQPGNNSSSSTEANSNSNPMSDMSAAADDSMIRMISPYNNMRNQSSNALLGQAEEENNQLGFTSFFANNSMLDRINSAMSLDAGNHNNIRTFSAINTGNNLGLPDFDLGLGSPGNLTFNQSFALPPISSPNDANALLQTRQYSLNMSDTANLTANTNDLLSTSAFNANNAPSPIASSINPFNIHSNHFTHPTITITPASLPTTANSLAIEPRCHYNNGLSAPTQAAEVVSPTSALTAQQLQLNETVIQVILSDLTAQEALELAILNQQRQRAAQIQLALLLQAFEKEAKQQNRSTDRSRVAAQAEAAAMQALHQSSSSHFSPYRMHAAAM